MKLMPSCPAVLLLDFGCVKKGKQVLETDKNTRR